MVLFMCFQALVDPSKIRITLHRVYAFPFLLLVRGNISRHCRTDISYHTSAAATALAAFSSFVGRHSSPT